MIFSIGWSYSVGLWSAVLLLYGVALLLHISISAFLTTYCMVLGSDAWIDPSGSFLMVHPGSCVGFLSCLMLYAVVRMAAKFLEAVWTG